MKLIKKGFYIFLPLILGSIIGLVISKYIDYPTLNKPPLSPPKILFPIMWSILYLLMGIAYYIYIKNSNKENIYYYIQLFFNLIWSILFFMLKLRFISIIWILFLNLFIIITIKSFKEESKISAYMLIPYLLWTLFATYLNIGIYILN